MGEHLMRQPRGKVAVPRRVEQVMKSTVGKAMPEECGMFDRPEYGNTEQIANHLIGKSTIWEEGKKSLEAVLGSKRTEELTIQEFGARKKTTKSLIKLIRKTVTMMQILLSIDIQECIQHERKYFDDRLTLKRNAIIQEMERKLPSEHDLYEIKIYKENIIYLRDVKSELQSEVALVKKLKAEFLTDCYEFQMNWTLLSKVARYQRSLNKYSLEWERQLKNVYDAVEKYIKRSKKVNSTESTEYLENMIKHINMDWEEALSDSREAIFAEVRRVLRDISAVNELVADERARRGRIQEAMRKSTSIAMRILDQFNKIIAYGFKKKPGEANHFLSFQKLSELNDYLTSEGQKNEYADWESTAVLSKRSIALRDASKLSTVGDWMVREHASFDVQQFKDCVDMTKMNKFRRDALGIKEAVEEIRCAKLEESDYLQVKDVSYYDRMSAYFAQKLTDAYRLAEDAYWRAARVQHQLADNGKETEEDTIDDRIDAIVSALNAFPDLKMAFVMGR